MITLNLLKQKKTYLSVLTFLLSLTTFSQDPVTTNNELITGVTIEYFFDEQVTDTKNNVIGNSIDGDVNTDWAAESSTGGKLIFDLEGTYNLAEIQYLTVIKSVAYSFEILVSSTGTDDADFTNVYGTDTKQESSLDGTFKSFVFPSVASNTKYVMLKCYGRLGDSAWNTISEITFYKEGATASTISNDLEQVSLYPTPTNNQLHLKNINDKVSKIEIFNLIGKKMISMDVEESNPIVNTTKLANGMYLVKLSDINNISASKMILVQH